ncbi:MAG: hypothetical protein GXP63_00615 [DPANN group archaeon]|nr:hypothetical protein [DPANN group archaeon]
MKVWYRLQVYKMKKEFEYLSNVYAALDETILKRAHKKELNRIFERLSTDFPVLEELVKENTREGYFTLSAGGTVYDLESAKKLLSRYLVLAA